MELLLTILLPLPLGFLLRSRLTAYLVYVAAHAFVFTFQTATLVIDWVGGDEAAFGPYPVASTDAVYGYGAVNLVIYLVGLGLVALGHRLGRKRRGAAPAAIDLAPAHR